MGAINKEDSGLYFSWGNTEGHAEGSGYNFSPEVYNTTPGAAIDTNLSLNQDAAKNTLGSLWRMPTNSEFKELVDNCTSELTTINDVHGRLFTSKVNGNQIFLPAAGLYDRTTLGHRETNGYYWSSSYDSNENADSLIFGYTTIIPLNKSKRSLGFSVRAVLKL